MKVWSLFPLIKKNCLTFSTYTLSAEYLSGLWEILSGLSKLDSGLPLFNLCHTEKRIIGYSNTLVSKVRDFLTISSLRLGLLFCSADYQCFESLKMNTASKTHFLSALTREKQVIKCNQSSGIVQHSKGKFF